MAKNNYWRKRELEQIKRNIRDDGKSARKLRSRYRDAMKDISTEIESFYGRYAGREGITMEVARKRVAKIDIEDYKRKAKKYVKEKNFTQRANEEMRLYNVTMRINRLELLKQNINLELLALGSEEERILYERLNEALINSYKHNSAILGMTVSASQSKARNLIYASFQNATWSDRIWTNQQALRAELDKLLHRGITQGRHPRELARELRKDFQSGVYNSERLLRTETARIQQDVFIDSMEQAEIDQYEFIAEPDACPICAALDGKAFKVKDARVGENAYPIHPNCRCSQAAYVDREKWEQSLNKKG